jgi:hypothetical protein
VLATLDIGTFIALNLIYSARGRDVTQAAPSSQNQLSAVSYLILSLVFLLIIGGLGWCFYKALMAAGSSGESESPDETSNEDQKANTI